MENSLEDINQKLISLSEKYDYVDYLPPIDITARRMLNATVHYNDNVIELTFTIAENFIVVVCKYGLHGGYEIVNIPFGRVGDLVTLVYDLSATKSMYKIQSMVKKHLV